MTAYLTVDDAPTETLPEKLEVLAERDVTVVFFCEGRRLADYADHALEAVEAGHVLGNHAYSHSHASELDVESFRDEVERTESLIEDVYERADAERPAKLFRFPYGDRGDVQADRFQACLADHGFVPPEPSAFAYDWYEEEHGDVRDWGWTVSVDDWEVDTPAGIRENVAANAERIESDPDDLLLFHDGGNGVAEFEAYLDALADYGVTFGDPLDLV
ncbi:polysaccharide deacetylase family protein [Halarchaeum sp. P4]|uniref:polysaccharide deacetylase family protein n=1 Tax=Halarchaeum sp. P4 TaxID=3421639 RepID=UPI003EBB99C4